jgi:CheY-like chemotaxis protein
MACVLIVDDAADALEPLARYLQKKGHAVQVARDGKEALSGILDRKPDVVVLDLMMPEIDGSSLLEVVRSYVRLQSLPVVVLTAAEDGPLIDRARNAKANAILKKSKASLKEIHAAVQIATSHTLT